MWLHNSLGHTPVKNEDENRDKANDNKVSIPLAIGVPFRPYVVPLVYMMIARSSGFGGDEMIGSASADALRQSS